MLASEQLLEASVCSLWQEEVLLIESEQVAGAMGRTCAEVRSELRELAELMRCRSWRRVRT